MHKLKHITTHSPHTKFSVKLPFSSFIWNFYCFVLLLLYSQSLLFSQLHATNICTRMSFVPDKYLLMGIINRDKLDFPSIFFHPAATLYRC